MTTDGPTSDHTPNGPNPNDPNPNGPTPNGPTPNDTADHGAGTERTSRRALHAYVSDEAHDMWHGFAAENGVSVSALLEVLGSRLLGLEPGAATPMETTEEVRAMIVDARKLDAARRSRRRTKS